VTALAGGGFVVTAYTTGGNPEVRTYTAAGVPTLGWVLVHRRGAGWRVLYQLVGQPP
jgi:hypothetical protein